MKSPDNVEKLIRVQKPRITTGSEMDRQVLDHSFAAMEEAIHPKSAARRPNVWKIIIRSRITKLAAAVVIIAVGLYVIQRERANTPQIPELAKSPGEMLTVMSLKIAYREGGMSALEKQYDKAFEMLGPRSTSISVKELLAEFNGS